MWMYITRVSRGSLTLHYSTESSLLLYHPPRVNHSIHEWRDRDKVIIVVYLNITVKSLVFHSPQKIPRRRHDMSGARCDVCAPPVFLGRENSRNKRGCFLFSVFFFLPFFLPRVFDEIFSLFLLGMRCDFKLKINARHHQKKMCANFLILIYIR